MRPDIRHVPAEEMLPWLRAMRTGLLADPGALSDSLLDYWRRIWQPDRIYGAFADGRCVGTLRTFGTSLSVPAGADRAAQVPAAALTQVTVATTYRRRGLLREMLTRSLADARERGEMVSLLRAAEWGIYPRFGYQAAIFGTNYTINTVSGPVVQAPRQPVEVVQLEPEQALIAGSAVLDRLRQHQAGQLDRPRTLWEPSLRLLGAGSGREPICVVARDAAGEPIGYAQWIGNDGDWFHDPYQQAQARIDQFLAATTDAERALWGYLTTIDLVRVLTLDSGPVDLTLRWLVNDGRIARPTWSGDNEWLCILDLIGTLTTRRYASTDRLVLEVLDPEGGFANGRVELDGGPEHAECRPTKASPDLRLSQRGLAGIYLGGTSVRSQQLAGLIEEETPGAAVRLQNMFRTERAPWNATPF